MSKNSNQISEILKQGQSAADNQLRQTRESRLYTLLQALLQLTNIDTHRSYPVEGEVGKREDIDSLFEHLEDLTTQIDGLTQEESEMFLELSEQMDIDRTVAENYIQRLQIEVNRTKLTSIDYGNESVITDDFDMEMESLPIVSETTISENVIRRVYFQREDTQPEIRTYMGDYYAIGGPVPDEHNSTYGLRITDQEGITIQGTVLGPTPVWNQDRLTPLDDPFVLALDSALQNIGILSDLANGNTAQADAQATDIDWDQPHISDEQSWGFTGYVVIELSQPIYISAIEFSINVSSTVPDLYVTRSDGIEIRLQPIPEQLGVFAFEGAQVREIRIHIDTNTNALPVQQSGYDMYVGNVKVDNPGSNEDYWEFFLKDRSIVE